MKLMESTIPFSGFFKTGHEAFINEQVENFFDHECSGRGSVNPACIEAWQFINWREIYEVYSAFYVARFANLLKCRLRFIELITPNEYNFRTDRIFVQIDLKTVKEIFERTEKDGLDMLIQSKFTSRDGFISMYSNSLCAWPESLEDWDPNQIGTLLEGYVAYSSSSTTQHLEASFWDSYELRDIISDTIYNTSAAGFKRLLKISRYLQERKCRV